MKQFCPMCSGKGTINNPNLGSTLVIMTCPGCGGAGYQDDTPQPQLDLQMQGYEYATNVILLETDEQLVERWKKCSIKARELIGGGLPLNSHMTHELIETTNALFRAGYGRNGR